MSKKIEQVGGDHYQTETGEQHWDLMWRWYGEAWFIGNITKYLLRYKKKDGIKDLEKAMTYLEKLISLETLNKQESDVVKNVEEMVRRVYDAGKEKRAAGHSPTGHGSND